MLTSRRPSNAAPTPHTACLPPPPQRICYFLAACLLIYTLHEVGDNPAYRDEMMWWVAARRQQPGAWAAGLGRGVARGAWTTCARRPEPHWIFPSSPAGRNFPEYLPIYTDCGNGPKDEKAGYAVV